MRAGSCVWISNLFDGGSGLEDCAGSEGGRLLDGGYSERL